MTRPLAASVMAPILSAASRATEDFRTRVLRPDRDDGS